MRTETILDIVLKFQVDRACLHGKKRARAKGGKVEKKKRE